MNITYKFFTGSIVFVSMGLSSKNTEEKSQQRPNILWLTFEDTSASEFGCYWNKDVHTPDIDTLASKGIQYMNAWSVAPQSSTASGTNNPTGYLLS